MVTPTRLAGESASTPEARDNPCADALDKLWRDVILVHKPKYGDWDYPGMAYRHLLAEFNELRGKLAGAQAELQQLRQEAHEAPEDMREYVNDTRQFILRGFPELDRLGIAMLYQHAHEGEWDLPTLAQHLVERLAAARTPVHENPSEVVATRMSELRRRAEVAAARAARLDEIARIIEAVDNRCMATDGPVTATLREMSQEEISRIYALASGTIESATDAGAP
jgi:hypothetical protein